jgi:hypothetical protein
MALGDCLGKEDLNILRLLGVVGPGGGRSRAGKWGRLPDVELRHRTSTIPSAKSLGPIPEAGSSFDGVWRRPAAPTARSRHADPVGSRASGRLCVRRRNVAARAGVVADDVVIQSGHPVWPVDVCTKLVKPILHTAL